MVTGGARSGKSAFAERIAEQTGDRLLFIATGKAIDEEMRERIENHRKSRCDTWETIEADGNVPELLAGQAETEGTRTVLIDCLAFYVADLMNTHDLNEKEIMEHFDRLINGLRSDMTLILVSNEVGSGVVPVYPVGRSFRDILGRVNQKFAAVADTVVMMVAGIPVEIKRELRVES